MSTLTKEWLQKTIAELEEERDATPGSVNEDAAKALAAMKIALASLEAEAVAFRSKLKPPSAIGGENWDYTDHRQPDAFELESCVIERLYTAPPAPVSAPDGEWGIDHSAGRPILVYKGCSVIEAEDAEYVLSLIAKDGARVPPTEPERHTISTDLDEGFEKWYTGDACGTNSIAPDWFSEALKPVFLETWRACRAAMLQGADGNSPVIPDGWVACSERMPDIGTEIFYFCQEDGLRDCGIVSSSNFSGKGDAELYVHAEGYDLRFGVDITHWMPLPASPQQK